MKYIKGFACIGLAICGLSLGLQRPQSPSDFSVQKPPLTLGNVGLHLIFHSVDSPVGRVEEKLHFIQQLARDWVQKGGDPAVLQSMMEKISVHASAHQFVEAEKATDDVLAMLGAKDLPVPNVSEELHRKERDSYLATAKTFHVSGTKRVATAARHYAPASFSSEPVDGNAPCKQMALAYFRDLTTGVKWHFDYGGNFGRCKESLADYRAVWMDAEYPKVDTALFFPTTSHYLENWNNWSGEGFNGGFPAGLQQYAEELRDRIDYDVVDERLVSEGFLDAYSVLIWPAGNVVETATVRRVRTWVENGGTLLVANMKGIHTVEGAPAFDGVSKGKGIVIEIGKDVNDLESKFPGKLDARDGVLMSTFSKGILVYNGTGQSQVRTISTASGSEEITLAPLEFKLYGTGARKP